MKKKLVWVGVVVAWVATLLLATWYGGDVRVAYNDWRIRQKCLSDPLYAAMKQIEAELPNAFILDARQRDSAHWGKALDVFVWVDTTELGKMSKDDQREYVAAVYRAVVAYILPKFPESKALTIWLCDVRKLKAFEGVFHLGDAYSGLSATREFWEAWADADGGWGELKAGFDEGELRAYVPGWFMPPIYLTKIYERPASEYPWTKEESK